MKVFYLAVGALCTFIPLLSMDGSSGLAKGNAIIKRDDLVNLCYVINKQQKKDLRHALHTQINGNKADDVYAYFQEWAKEKNLSLESNKKIFDFLKKAVEKAKEQDNFLFCYWLATELEKNSRNDEVIEFLNAFIQELPLTREIL
jgi:hypothetical protein